MLVFLLTCNTSTIWISSTLLLFESDKASQDTNTISNPQRMGDILKLESGPSLKDWNRRF